MLNLYDQRPGGRWHSSASADSTRPRRWQHDAQADGDHIVV